MNKVLYDKENKKIIIDDIENNVYYKDNSQYFLKLKELIENTKFINRTLNKKEYQSLKKWIDLKVPFLKDCFFTYLTKAYFIFSNLIDFPLCSVCKSKKIDNINVKPLVDGFTFSRGCSFKCRQKDPIRIKKIENTVLNRYGVRNINQNKDIRKKATLTRKNKNNGNYFSNKSLEQQKETCLKKYGFKSYTQTNDFKIKSKKTFLKHYGVDNNMKCEDGRNKFKKSIIEKYGVDNIAKDPNIQSKIRTRYYYNEKNFDTIPELAFFIWLSDKKIQFEFHNGEYFDYKFNSKYHRYFPDFKVKNIFYEIKGDQFLKEDGTWQNPYDHTQDDFYEAKHQCAIKNNVVILTSKDYKKYVDYVKEKYGKDYLKKFKKK